MTEEGNGGGRVVFTVKDLLANIDKKLDVLNAKLDTKADAQRLQDVFDYTSAVERRLAQVEMTMVRREGPIVDGLRDYEKRVEKFESTLDTRIDDAIEEARDRTFSFREKLALSLFAGVGAAGTVISTVVLLFQVHVL